MYYQHKFNTSDKINTPWIVKTKKVNLHWHSMLKRELNVGLQLVLQHEQWYEHLQHDIHQMKSF